MPPIVLPTVATNIVSHNWSGLSFKYANTMISLPSGNSVAEATHHTNKTGKPILGMAKAVVMLVNSVLNSVLNKAII
jgi:hypothetical protein